LSERLFLRLDEDRTQAPESEAPAGTLRALPLGASLQGAVAHVLAYREAIAPGREVIERVLPDGAVRMVFHLGSGTPGAVDGAAPAALVVGAHAAPVIVRLRGAMDGLSVTLRHGAALALFGVPAGEIEGTTVPLDALWGGEAARLLEHLSSATDDASRLRALRAALQRRLRAQDAVPSQLVDYAASLMRDCDGQRSVRDVAAAVGIGERRLQQLFHAQVGLSPRTFGRLLRLHAMLRTLRQQPERSPWAHLAIDAGYYDQAHLANEFHALCGMTPGEFVRRSVSLSSKTAA
jgi:AraC-like DNA-binding protein